MGSTVEADVDDLLDYVPAVSGAPSMSDQVFVHLPLQTVARELVRKIHPPETIAARYGMTEQQLLLLCEQPGFRKLARFERQLWEGSDNAGERAKAYHREGQAFAASAMVAWMLDESLPIGARLDAAKLSARIAGIDAVPKTDGNMAAAGTTFAVNFHFTDRPSERISTTVGPTINAGPVE